MSFKAAWPKILKPLKLLEELKSKPESFWLKRGEKNALKLFHLAAVRVPAYKDFLLKNHILREKIKTIKDFQYVPPVDKDNYLSKYSRQSLAWDGNFKNDRWVISTTSGSTGEPFYFPRQDYQDEQYALFAELYLRSNFKIHERSTLYIVGFPMGAWIGGLFTYEALQRVAKKGNYNLSIITPGINKQEILKAIKKLGPEFDQILIGSYGPFLKDIIDDGPHYGVRWKDYQMGFILSAEAFSENFRDYIINKTGAKNIYTSSLNHYGTVDLGTMSFETPLSILLRREALKNSSLYQSLFGQTTKLPTLTQFLPELFYFEESGGGLYCSAWSGYPLVRYNLKDNGGVFSLDKAKKICAEHKIDLTAKSKSSKIQSTWWNLPFVHVYERSDFSVSFFAFQIYPETIRKALQNRLLGKRISTKFTMMVKFDKKSNQYLEINIELKPFVKKTKTLERQIVNLVVGQLLRENSEYRKTHEHYSNQVQPKIVFWEYEDKTYFTPGIKQKWIKK